MLAQSAWLKLIYAAVREMQHSPCDQVFRLDPRLHPKYVQTRSNTAEAAADKFISLGVVLFNAASTTAVKRQNVSLFGSPAHSAQTHVHPYACPLTIYPNACAPLGLLGSDAAAKAEVIFIQSPSCWR